jgi:DNA polymerase-3 subunit epsilon
VKLLVRDKPGSEPALEYARAAMPAGRTPWRDAEYCAVDLELSGLDPRCHEIISFAAVPIRNGRVALPEAVHGLVRPSGAVPGESVLVHGIRTLDLTGAPDLDDAVDALLGVARGRVLVAHSAGVERAFLGPALRRRGVRLRGPIVDTEAVGRLWLHERDGGVPPRIALGSLAAGLRLPSHSPHTALGDALTAAQVFLATATHLDVLRSETVRSLSRAHVRLSAAAMYANPRDADGEQ